MVGFALAAPKSAMSNAAESGSSPNNVYLPLIIGNIGVEALSTPVLPAAQPFPNIPPEPAPPQDVYANCIVAETHSEQFESSSWFVRSYKTTSYNERSQPVKRSYDENGDRTSEFMTDYIYGSTGKITSEATINPTTGMPVSSTRYYYDTAGKLTRSEDDYNGDGSVDHIYSPLYDYSGYIVGYRSDLVDNSIQKDENGRFFWNERGELIREEGDWFSADGVSDIIYYHSWQSGLPVQTDVDYQNREGIDRRRRYLYDDERRLVEFQTSVNVESGRVYSKAVYSYSEPGLVVDVKGYTGNSLEDTLHYVYDGQNRLTMQETTSHFWMTRTEFANRCVNDLLLPSAFSLRRFDVLIRYTLGTHYKTQTI